MHALLKLFLAFVAIFALVTVVFAEDQDEVHDRELHVEYAAGHVELEGVAPNNRDRVEFQIEVMDSDDDLVESEFKWRMTSVANNNETEHEIELQFRLISVVEYQESNGNPGFQAGEEVSTYGGDGDFNVTNNEATWGAFSASSSVVAGNATIYSFEATTTDGVLTVRGTISTAAAVSNGVSLTPNSVKIDIEIADYPGKTATSFLALICRLKAKQEVETDDHEGEQVTFHGAAALPVATLFGWAPTLTVDSNSVDVVATSLKPESSDEDGRDYKIVFSFPAAGDSYVWDPTTGVTYATAASSAASLQPFYFNFF